MAGAGLNAKAPWVGGIVGVALAGLMTALASSQAFADGRAITLHGSGQGAPACSTCHGSRGEGQAAAGFPALAGLPAPYIEHELASFANGSRQNAIMGPIAKALDATERQAVAEYYAGLPAPKPTKPASAIGSVAAEGRTLASRGDWSVGLPACSQCHGASGQGVGSSFPPLKSQSSAYIASQLTAWKAGSRRDDPMGLMAGVAKKLSTSQIAAVAAFYGNASAAPAPNAAPVPSARGKQAKPIQNAGRGAAFTPPPESAIPHDQFGAMVRLGEHIFHNTQRYAAGFVGDQLQCSNCHIDRGRLAGASPMWAAYVAFPAYRSKNGHVNTFQERMQGCFRFSMNGKAPPLNSKTLVALETYSYFLAKGAPTGAHLAGRGYPKLKKPALPMDYARGARVYTQRCSLCHGASGQGRASADGRTVFPPLWGAHSFNWGAGMGSVSNAANFIKANMPFSQGGSLTNQQAWDVALFVDSHDRPQDPRFVGSVAQTRQKFHNSPMSMYGRRVNGVLLGQNSPPAGPR